MSTRRHLNVIPSVTDGDQPRATPRLPRDIVLAVIVVVILFAGVGVGGAFSPQPESQGSLLSVIQPSSDFVYFPGQYVNEAKEPSPDIPTF